MLDDACSVLLVDDDFDDQYLIVSALDELKLNVQLGYCESGWLALKKLSRMITEGAALPNFVLLDINMPEMDGVEFLHLLRKKRGLEQLPVVVYTTSRAEHDMARCYEAGANTYVVKPSNYTEIKSVLAKLCAYWGDTSVCR